MSNKECCDCDDLGIMYTINCEGTLSDDASAVQEWITLEKMHWKMRIIKDVIKGIVMVWKLDVKMDTVKDTSREQGKHAKTQSKKL